jgi:hypothetical protein
MGDDDSGTRTLSEADLDALAKRLTAEGGGVTLKADESLNDVLAEAAEQIAEHDDVMRDSAALKDLLVETVANENDGDGEGMADEEDEEEMEMSADELAEKLASTEKMVGMDTLVTMLGEMDAITAPEEEIADALAMLAGDDMGGETEETEASEHGDEEDDDEMDKSANRATRSNLGKGAGATGGDVGTTAGGEGATTSNPLKDRTAAITDED